MASTNSFRASSCSNSSIAAPKRYDVFLSFRGKDTRNTFTDHLYQALVRRGIRTFRDDNKLRRGEAIAPELLNAIEESRSSVIVFSENYAHSRWCLDELVKIMDCQRDHVAGGHTVFPIFYHVDPSDVRNQTGSFGEAFASYEEKWKNNEEGWRRALREAGNLSGWHLKDGYESDYIKEIIDCILCKLGCQRLFIDANLVGIDSRLKELHLRLHMESNDVRIVGVYGLGGIGKTTIAKAIYNRLSCEFEYMSFLENVSEVFNTKGLSYLQSQLVSDILREQRNRDIKNDGLGASMVKTILLSKRVLIVLDDVDDQDQMEYLIGIREWAGKGSRVIITTRDTRLLTLQEVDDLYEVPGLDWIEAFILFRLHAFKQNCPKLGSLNLSRRAISYCKGLPLALKVLGSLLFNKTIPEWESELHKLETVPEAKIHKVLKRSYAGLDRTEKNILLDVACFLKGEDIVSVVRILDGCDFYALRGLQNLYDKSLIAFQDVQVSMHDLIQQMCWEIVRENFPYEPNKWSRLWDPHDIERALRACEGIHGVETISLDLSKLKRVRFNPNALAKMTRLRLLKVHSGWPNLKLDMDFEFPYELRYLYWSGFPLQFLPYDGENLTELHLAFSNIKQLWQEDKFLERLKVINMSYSKKLIQMPEFSSMPNLEELCLTGCESLIDIHLSIGVLKKLEILNLSMCEKLNGLPSSIINLEALVVLNLSGCSSFEKFPEIQGNMRSLRYLRLRQTAIRELPNGCDLESVEVLDLSNCLKFEKFPENGAKMKSLNELHLANTVVKELPTGIVHWESLPVLDLSNCPEFEKFPEKVGNMKCLKKLLLNNTAIKDLPDSIGEFESLEILNLSYCYKFEKFPEKVGNMKRLKEIHLDNTAIKNLPDSIGNLESLEILDLSCCSKFEKFPEVGNMKSLTKLLLNSTAIKNLPDSIGNLESLEILLLSDCSKFKKVPEKVGNMKILKQFHLDHTAIKNLPDSIGDLESLEILDLSHCSKLKDLPESILDLKFLKFLDLAGCFRIEKFPELKWPWNNFLQICIRWTAINEFRSSIHNLYRILILNKAECNEEEWSLLLWYRHLNWLSSSATHQDLRKYMRLLVAIPEITGGLYPEWIRYCDIFNLGSKGVTVVLPMNWYEDPKFRGFVVSCVYCPLRGISVDDQFIIHGNGFDFKKGWNFYCSCLPPSNMNDQVWVCWYPKIAIPKEHLHNNFTHFTASFGMSKYMRKRVIIKKSGVNLIFAEDGN